MTQETTDKKQRKLAPKIFMAGVSTLLAVLLLEFMANKVIMNADDGVFLKYASLEQLKERYGSYNQLLSGHRYLGYYPTPGYEKGPNRHNALGYRGEEIVQPKPDDEFRIVCLGGSTTYTVMVDDYKLAYPYLMQEALHEKGFTQVQVINSGASSWSSWESMINSHMRVLDLNPDLIVVYHGVNDVHPRMVWPPEAYQGDNSGYRMPVFSNMFMPPVLEYSAIYRILMVKSGKMSPHVALTRTQDTLAETSYTEEFEFQRMNAQYPDGIFKEVNAAKMLQENGPVYFLRNIDNIVVSAQANGVKPVLATFATSPLFAGQPRVASPEYIAAYAEMNEALKVLGEKRNAAVFDFEAVFPDDQKYYTDGRHVNEAGSRLKAQLFADFLVESKLLEQE